MIKTNRRIIKFLLKSWNIFLITRHIKIPLKPSIKSLKSSTKKWKVNYRDLIAIIPFKTFRFQKEWKEKVVSIENLTIKIISLAKKYHQTQNYLLKKSYKVQVLKLITLLF
jgi:hypothetical protein